MMPTVNSLRPFTRKFGLHKRESSFPFISGDTYKGLCNLVYSGNNSRIEQEVSSNESYPVNRIFLPLSFSQKFIHWVTAHELDLTNVDLFMHNGDIIPSNEDMARLANRFRNIYSVNWTGNSENIVPIPIGLENRRLHTNGVPRDFAKIIAAGIPTPEIRKNQILISFSMSTNLSERSTALELTSRYSKIDLRFFQGSVTDYHRELLESRYVLSPPGNGFDCHRTWEAIYLGCIPIVKREFWPFCHLNLPVLVLDDWSDISRIEDFQLPSQLGIDELSALFLKI
jgi:hypothetical protein